jgi:hypothetical protein
VTADVEGKVQYSYPEWHAEESMQMAALRLWLFGGCGLARVLSDLNQSATCSPESRGKTRFFSLTIESEIDQILQRLDRVLKNQVYAPKVVVLIALGQISSHPIVPLIYGRLLYWTNNIASLRGSDLELMIIADEQLPENRCRVGVMAWVDQNDIW